MSIIRCCIVKSIFVVILIKIKILGNKFIFYVIGAPTGKIKGWKLDKGLFEHEFLFNCEGQGHQKQTVRWDYQTCTVSEFDDSCKKVVLLVIEN